MSIVGATYVFIKIVIALLLAAMKNSGDTSFGLLTSLQVEPLYTVSCLCSLDGP